MWFSAARQGALAHRKLGKLNLNISIHLPDVEDCGYREIVIVYLKQNRQIIKNIQVI